MDFRKLRDGDQEGLWITHKAARLGAYQKLAEDALKYLDAGWLEDSKTASSLGKLVTACLRNAAEEVGDLKGQQEASGTLTVRLEGVDMEAL